jgi:hypothetical protein
MQRRFEELVSVDVRLARHDRRNPVHWQMSIRPVVRHHGRPARRRGDTK